LKSIVTRTCSAPSPWHFEYNKSDGVEVQKHGTWYPSYSWLIYQLVQQNKETGEPTVL
jgi:hypothetical protein